MSSFTERKFTQVFADARAFGLLNAAITDDGYTDAQLLPHGAYAHNKIQAAFAKSGLPLAETVTTSLTYAANAETIVVPAGVTDLSAPLEIWEKNPADSLWVPMQRVTGLRPSPSQASSALSVWEWRNGTIVVLPCSSARDIFCRYRRQLAYPAADSTMGFDGIYFALVSGTVYYAATTRPDVQAKAQGMFASDIEDAVAIASRDRQSIVYQQRGWRDRGSRRGITIETA